MKGENQDVIDEFETWKETRDRCFVNPMREANEIIAGALNLCEGGVIGSGGQGLVKVKLNMINGDILAVKVIDFPMFRGQDSIWDEMKDDSRRRITVCMDYIKGPSLEDSLSLCSGSVNLKSVLEKRPSWWTKSVLSIVILGIARGIDYIHGQGFVHRDLKPSNVSWSRFCSSRFETVECFD